VALWNAGRISSNAAEKPPDVMTLTCAVDAVGKARAAAIAKTNLMRACPYLFMWPWVD
jgi:hypothetical protein